MAERGKGFGEAFARFFEAPTREGLRDLLRESVGEANELDFKREWLEESKLAKHVLGLANFGGGCVVVGIDQGEEGALNPVGLPVLTDKTDVLSSLNNYLPDTLMRQVEILDFSYEESEYSKLKGKSFQVLFVKDDPTHLPFLSTKGGRHVTNNRVYTRRGVATEEASQDELQRILSRRLETGYSSRRELDLRTHLEQLKILFEQTAPYNSVFKGGFAGIGEVATRLMQRYAEQVPNPNYPKEDYETFVVRAIARKKQRIEKELDIEDIPSPDTF